MEARMGTQPRHLLVVSLDADMTDGSPCGNATQAPPCGVPGCRQSDGGPLGGATHIDVLFGIWGAFSHGQKIICGSSQQAAREDSTTLTELRGTTCVILVALLLLLFIFLFNASFCQI